ncbi:YeaH/YhbH family protein [Aquibacillus koreensis]|uniref:YeaH/YhbH family protein n=1 Tax=Aquibacillus koreensis TaxID=279446 RepID=A0A9X3WRT0_9BACI|nr:YeaH/YhbH family protein [Aquibacillus koreensis]MCT2534942.1 YeaH/YhbH family protein [Aquibacillus koreensis]MDC3422164.1 YeaH/YhbH family protein [Aquibacillus koreensis]
MEVKKIHYLFVGISYIYTLLHLFLSGKYEQEDIVSGFVFFTCAYILYVVFVYLYFKSEPLKKIVVWGLFILFICSVVLFFIAI